MVILGNEIYNKPAVCFAFHPLKGYARGAINNLNASAHYWTATRDADDQIGRFKLDAYTETAGLEKVDPGFALSIRFFKDK